MEQPSASAAGRDADAPSGALIALGLAVFAAVWLPSLAATALSPPLDNVEQLAWVRSLEGGYYKHPPLPTWLLWPVVQLVGWNAWATYGLGAACTLAALGVHWRLTSELMGRSAATVALLAELGITYYSGRLNYYNHNILLLLAVSTAAYASWQALASGRRRWWAALGLAIGAGAMSKYQVAIAVLPMLAVALRQRAWRQAVHWQGLAIALSITAACFAPHLAWLVRHDFAPVGYAMETSLGVQLGAAARSALALQWLADQVLNRGLPALILLGIVGWPLRRAAPPPPAGARAPDAVFFQLAWGALPLLAMTLIGMATGAELQLQWGTAYLLFIVPALMALAERQLGVAWPAASLKRALWTFAVLQALLLVINVATSPKGPQALHNTHFRTFDSAQLAERLGPPARAALGGPIRIVAGDTPRTGALALRLAEQPLLLIDGRLDRSPWLTAGQVRACGVLWLMPAKDLPGGLPLDGPFAGLAWKAAPRDTSVACSLDR